MRFLEILMAGITGLTLAGWLCLRWRLPGIVHLLPLTAVLIVPLHLLIDGYRWQMVPLYTLSGILFVFSLMVILSPPGTSSLIRTSRIRMTAED